MRYLISVRGFHIVLAMLAAVASGCSVSRDQFAAYEQPTRPAESGVILESYRAALPTLADRPPKSPYICGAESPWPAVSERHVLPTTASPITTVATADQTLWSGFRPDVRTVSHQKVELSGIKGQQSRAEVEQAPGRQLKLIDPYRRQTAR